MCAADMLFGSDIGGASAAVVPQAPRPRCSSHSKCGGEGGRGLAEGRVRHRHHSAAVYTARLDHCSHWRQGIPCAWHATGGLL
jgi:hypothetical protein